MKEKCRFTHSEQETARLRQAIADNNGTPPSIAVFRGRSQKVIEHTFCSSVLSFLSGFTSFSVCLLVCT